MYGFYPILGWGVLWIAFIVAIILFAKYRKIYPVFYMISVALYIFTAGFAIDVFELGKFGILSVLVFSAIIFMLLGWYLSTIVNQDSDSRQARQR